MESTSKSPLLGLRQTLRPLFAALRTVTRILRGKHRPDHFLRRRAELGQALAARLGNTVGYGPDLRAARIATP